MPRTRRTFTDEFKREAVKLVKQPGAMVTHIAKDLGIEQSVLRRWVSKEHGGVMDMRANKQLCSESASEVERLQRELRRVRPTLRARVVGAIFRARMDIQEFRTKPRGLQVLDDALRRKPKDWLAHDDDGGGGRGVPRKARHNALA